MKRLKWKEEFMLEIKVIENFIQLVEVGDTTFRIIRRYVNRRPIGSGA
jgi:hypothetical protein